MGGSRLVLKSPVFCLFWQFFEQGHCHRNSPSQLGFLNTKFWGWSGLFPVLGPKNFLFGHPIFIGEFQWQCASIKIAKKGKRPDFQALMSFLENHPLTQLEGDNSATCRIFCKTKNSAKCRMFYHIRKLQNAESWQNVCNFLIW